MTELGTIISECETNAIPDGEIDTSEIPPVTDFSGFQFGNPMIRESQKQLNDFLMTAYLNGQI